MSGDITDSVLVNKSTLDPAFVNLIFGDEIKSSAGNVLYPKSEGFSQGDLILIDSTQGEAVGIRRYIDLSKINEKPMISSNVENPAGYYSDQAGVIVYDNPPGNRAHFNDGSYVFQLAVPVKGTGSFFKIMQPLNSSGAIGTLSSYYADGLNVYGTNDTYVGVASAGFSSIVVAEEIKHSDDGNCQVRVRTGTTADLKYMDTYGFFDASRIFVNYISGDPQRLYIFNLLPEHNGKR